ncbi:MAG: hypothetical protein COB59_01340 [Rhodospirillaceae bacterium]|nr:MAG: hypothetical protein COB59_01340 [Rhodospirillaceae bacterium]
MLLKFTLPLAIMMIFSIGVSAEELRVGGQPLDQAINLPSSSGAQHIHINTHIYVGNLPKEVKEFDVRAPFGRVDYSEIGAFLAAQISGKTVTGSASMKQALLLMRMAKTGDGLTGEASVKLKAVYHNIRDELNVMDCRMHCN